MNENKLHERQFSKWTKDEEKKLLTEIKNKKSIDDIANEHYRSKGGIKARIKHIARELVEEGKSKDEILKITGLSTQEYYKAINNKSSNLYKKNIIINQDDDEINESVESNTNHNSSDMKQINESIESNTNHNSSDMKQVIELLIEIRDLLKTKDM